MGKDAVILHSRKFKEGGFLGFFAREKFEVTAAVDPGMLNNAGPGGGQVLSAGAPASAFAANAPDAGKEFMPVQEQRTSLPGGRVPVLWPQSGQYSCSYPYSYPPALRMLYQQLLDHEVEEKIVVQLFDKLMGSLSPSEWNDVQLVKKLLSEEMARMLVGPQLITLEGQRLPKTAVMVGPTGVGKTTTIAKLAASFSILQKKRVALVTIDTYRIAAVEQLKTYAQIIGIPLEVVFTPRALRESLQRHLDKDLLLIDTAGRSPKNERQMEELSTFLNVLPEPEIYLVVSATTSGRDMWDVYRRFQRLNFTRIIFTKLDETDILGPLFNISYRSGVALSYMTTGQNVPDDIEIGHPSWLVSMILNGGVGSAERPSCSFA